MIKLSPEISARISEDITTLLNLPDDASFKQKMQAMHLDPATDMCGANLSGLDLSGEDLRDINFAKCDCRDVNWHGADIARCNFKDARFNDPWAIYLAKNAHLAKF